MAFPTFSPFVQMGMGGPMGAQRVSNQGTFLDEGEDNPPAKIVAPQDMNIDPSTMSFDPIGYFNMAKEALSGGGGEQAQPDPTEQLNRPHPESVPIIQAIETGYADKKIMNPVDMIRQGIAANDLKAVDKGREKLIAALTGDMNPVDKFLDSYMTGTFFSQGRVNRAQKHAADVVMNELMRPRAVEAVQGGLMQQGELIPGEQTRPVFENLIPAADMAMEPSPYLDEIYDPSKLAMPSSSVQPSMRPAQPGQQPAGDVIDPQARLTDLQMQTVGARQKLMTHPAARGGAGRGPTPTDVTMLNINNAIQAMEDKLGRPLTAAEKVPIIEKAQGMELKYREQESKDRLRAEQINNLKATGEMRRYYGERAKLDAEQLIPARAYALNRLGDLREVQMDLIKAQTDFQRQLPALKRELAGAPAFETEAIQRVHKAITEKKPIEKADWLIVERWLRKGSPQFSMDFLGRAFDRLTGQRAEPGKPFGWLGLPEPPLTFDEPATQALQESDEDLISRFGAFLKSLLFGTGEETPKGETKEPTKAPEATPALPTPKTPAEAQKLKPGTRYKTPDGKIMVR